MNEIRWGKLVESSHELNPKLSKRNIIAKNKNQGTKKNIGFFLGYLINVGFFEGEGIGRFITRLVKGLLYNFNDVTITIATTSHNYDTINRAFRDSLSSYPNRLNIQKFYSVEWVNKNISVDVWIVPYVGMKLALQLNKPFIVCLHDLAYTHLEDLYKTQPNIYDNFTALADKVVTKATRVVFNSNHIRNNEGLKFFKLPKEKTEVIRLAAPLEEYGSISSCNESVFRDKYKLHDNYITYPTVIRFHKNHDRLIEAFLKFRQTDEGSMSNLRLVLTDNYKYGPKHKEIVALLDNCKDENTKNSVVFLGRLPWHDVPLLYKYAIGTIVPTRFEGGFPWPILESLTMGTPVAMSRIEVVKEVLTDLDTFITFDPYSIEEIEKAIRELWRNRKIILGKQKKAIQHVLARTWADVAFEYTTLINSI